MTVAPQLPESYCGISGIFFSSSCAFNIRNVTSRPVTPRHVTSITGRLTESEHLVELYSTNFNISESREFKQLFEHTCELGVRSLDADKETKSVERKYVRMTDKK
eukprot:11993495-Ditylum_brightwellii.AAC.1